jgi:hypothetical protein
MPKKTLIITILAIAIIGLAAITVYALQGQEGEERKRFNSRSELGKWAGKRW